MATNQTASIASATDIRDIVPPVEISSGWEWLWWTLGGLALVVILLVLSKWWRRRATQIPVIPPLPAHVRAKQKLQEALTLIAQPKPFVIAVSDTTRCYLEERFQFRAPERTTEEFLHELKRTDLLTRDQKESLSVFLGSCDLVKFAKYEPGEPELRDLHASAVRLVEETEPAEVPSPESRSKVPRSHDVCTSIFASAAPGAAVGGLAQGRRGKPPAFVYSSVQLLRGVQDITKSQAGGFLAALRWLALALLIIALAQPRLTKFDTTKATASGVDIVVAFDLSGSMAAEDFAIRGQRVNRVRMAKEVLQKFVARRSSDRIGLVAFGTQAFIASPITLDHDFLLKNLERLDLNTINGSQTAIGSALSTGVNRLRELKSRSKIVILMTDGVNNAGKVAPLTAAEAAQALGVKVYTIGVGSQGTAPMPAGRNPFSGQIVYHDVLVDIDESTLQKISDMTGGKYYRADNADKFQAIYAEIDKLEKTEADVKKFAQHTELFAWLIAAGLVLLTAEITMGQTMLRRLP